LDCLKYAIEQECPRNMKRCMKVAIGECKKYLESLMGKEITSNVRKARRK
jgi:hypothetical protein